MVQPFRGTPTGSAIANNSLPAMILQFDPKARAALVSPGVRHLDMIAGGAKHHRGEQLGGSLSESIAP